VVGSRHRKGRLDLLAATAIIVALAAVPSASAAATSATGVSGDSGGGEERQYLVAGARNALPERSASPRAVGDSRGGRNLAAARVPRRPTPPAWPRSFCPVTRI
jgi:hypothetical protein